MTQKRLTDEEARKEARKRFGERAEEKLLEIASKIGKGEWWAIKDPKLELKELRRLFQAAHVGSARFLEVSDRLKELVYELEKEVVPPTLEYGYGHIQALRKASEVFLELAT